VIKNIIATVGPIAAICLAPAILVILAVYAIFFAPTLFAIETYKKSNPAGAFLLATLGNLPATAILFVLWRQLAG
jgi:hypothetical protein